MADEFQYIRLPDGSYGKFLSSASDAQIRQAIEKDFPQAFATKDKFDQKASSTLESTQADLQYAQQTGGSLMDRRKAAAAALPTTTAGQVGAEENRPFSRAWEAGSNAVSQGAGQVMQGNALQKIMGALRIANAPSEAAGSAVGTTIQNILGNVPGLGGPGGVVPSGAAALGDAGTQLLTGPAAIRGGIKAVKSITQIPGRIVAPGHIREAGAEAMAMAMGQPGQAIERVFQTPASKAAYMLAETQGPVQTKNLADILDQTFFKHADLANPDQGALKYLSNLYEKFATRPKLSYGDVMEEIKMLKREADSALAGERPNSALGTTLMQAREYLISELDRISPLYRQANRLYRQEQAVTDIMNVARMGTPGNQLEKLIENHPDIAKSFSKGVIKEISYIAHQLSDVASATPAGGFRQTVQALAKPIADMTMGGPTGRAILRQVLSPATSAKRLPKTAGELALAAYDDLPKSLTAAIQTYKALYPNGENRTE